jgi:tRNA 2-selenouridine synthase
VLGGKTGSGKTQVLHELKKLGEQVIDLEALAHHKGSSFGSLGEEKQNSQEQFENELSSVFATIDPEKRCWVENESRKVGVNVLPEKLWEQMRDANVVNIELPIEERINYLVKEYGAFSKEELIDATSRITKRLGGQHAKAAIEAIESGDLRTACEISLVYYDKTYSYSNEQRVKEKVRYVPFEKLDPIEIAKKLKQS